MSILEKIHKQLNLDRETIEALNKDGNNENAYRSIDHSFWSLEKENLDELSIILKNMEFDNPEVKEGRTDDGDKYYYLETKTKDNTKYHNIVKTSVLMECLAVIHHVEYDGWGTTIETT